MIAEEYMPYYNLLKAICNCDSEENVNKSVIAVYDILDNDRLVAVFSKAKYCARFFKTTNTVINCQICRGNIRNGRYKIERIYFNGRD